MATRLDKAEICNRLEKAILSLCRSCLPNDDIAIDAIICLSVTQTSEEHVVKIHQNFTASVTDGENEFEVNGDCSDKDYEIERPLKIAWNVSKKHRVQQSKEFQSSAVDQACQDSASVDSSRTTVTSPPNTRYRHTRFGSIKVPKVAVRLENKSKAAGNNSTIEQVTGVSDKDRSLQGHESYDLGAKSGEPKPKRLYSGETDNVNNVDGFNVKMEPLDDSNYSIQTDSQRQDSMTTNDCLSMKTSFHNNRNLDVNSPKNNVLDTSRVSGLFPFVQDSSCSPYHYTVDFLQGSTSSKPESSHNVPVRNVVRQKETAEKDAEDDNQSLGGSPTDLTNSLISYSLNHILPPGDQEDDDLSSPMYLQSTARLGGQVLNSPAVTRSRQIREIAEASFSHYDCKFCGARFCSKRTRNRHENSTCGKTKFECILCNKYFSRKDARRRHMLRAHGADQLLTS